MTDGDGHYQNRAVYLCDTEKKFESFQQVFVLLII